MSTSETIIRHGADGKPLRVWRIGNVTVTRIVELVVPAQPHWVLTGATPEHVARNQWLKPYFATEDCELLMSIHGFVLESQGVRIMADSCVGNGKRRSLGFYNMLQTSFYQDLESAGFEPNAFDFAVCTHLHADHCGWSTRQLNGQWILTFPNARYLIGRVEYEQTVKGNTKEHDWHAIYEDTVRPLFDAGVCDLVDANHRITEEVRLVEAHGHSAGHVCVLIESNGERAIITGDMIHHPIQLSELDLSSTADNDVAQARRTRERFIAECSGTSTLVLGCHFADPTGGWIVPAGDAWRLKVDIPANTR